jgi:hypothetical protein
MTNSRRQRRVKTIDPNDDPLNEGRSLAELPDDARALYAPPSVAQDFQIEEEEINAALADAGGGESGGSIVMRLRNPRTGKFEWLGRMLIAEYMSHGGVAHLASKYGGGEYELIIYGADGLILKRPKVTVASSVVAELKADSSLSGVDKLAAAMMEGFRQIAQQQSQFLQQLNRPHESKADWLREMQIMKEMFGAGGNKQSDLEALVKVVPLVRDLMPRGEGETNFLDVVLRIAQEFGPAIRTAVEKSPALAAPVNAPPVIPTPLSAEQQGANQMQIVLKAQLAMLCREAENDADPQPYAEIIVNKVAPDMLQKLVNNPAWLDDLAKVHPGVKLFPTWFGELRELVVEIMTEPENPDNLTGGTEAGKSPEIPTDGILPEAD